MKTVYVIAGEASGDLHAANLIRRLTPMLSGWRFRGVGGDQMHDAGVEIFRHIRQTNFMGFVEVAKHLPEIIRLFRDVKRDVVRTHPDFALLVDYPGFNLRMTTFFRRMGIPVYYYIAPQLWAWKKGRVKIFKKHVERLFVILPFEPAFFAGEGLEVEFHGHPILDVEAIASSPPMRSDGPIALLPGSRPQEIRKHLPTMLEAAATWAAEMEVVVAGAPTVPPEFYGPFLRAYPRVTLLHNRTHETLAVARAALTASGTATLETALFNVPQAVCYKGGAISFFLAKRLVKVPFISLVNLILGRRVVAEYIQYDVTSYVLRMELESLLFDVDKREKMARDYTELRQVLGGSGASLRLAHSLAQRWLSN
jgi:lipid-A-disaccharide synthase